MVVDLYVLMYVYIKELCGPHELEHHFGVVYVSVISSYHSYIHI